MCIYICIFIYIYTCRYADTELSNRTYFEVFGAPAFQTAHPEGKAFSAEGYSKGGGVGSWCIRLETEALGITPNRILCEVPCVEYLGLGIGVSEFWPRIGLRKFRGVPAEL